MPLPFPDDFDDAAGVVDSTDIFAFSDGFGGLYVYGATVGAQLNIDRES
jgi:hypothetical protein